MKTAKEIIDQINNAKINSPYRMEDIMDMDGITEVTTTTINRDEHRWYVFGTMVFKVGDEFFGVRGPISLKSESMDYSDVGATCTAFEMIEVPFVTYKMK